jgi:hypothetical protein
MIRDKADWLTLFGLVTMNWCCYALIFFGQFRYNYTA